MSYRSAVKWSHCSFQHARTYHLARGCAPDAPKPSLTVCTEAQLTVSTVTKTVSYTATILHHDHRSTQLQASHTGALAEGTTAGHPDAIEPL